MRQALVRQAEEADLGAYLHLHIGSKRSGVGDEKVVRGITRALIQWKRGVAWASCHDSRDFLRIANTQRASRCYLHWICFPKTKEVKERCFGNSEGRN